MPRKNPSNSGCCSTNTRTRSSAAAFAGCIGLPEPSGHLVLNDGGLRSFCRLFNRRFDQLAETTRPEFRAFARAEREAYAISSRPPGVTTR